MRPAYRFALASGVVGVLGLTTGAWLLWPRGHDRVQLVAPPPVEQRADPLPLRPEGVQPVGTPVVGTPDPQTQAELLDQLEDFEGERFGPSEAARRRRTRERLLRGRTMEGP
ncbi:MAG: hypothetical protein KTR31_19740 [Myxococcales bacterium]|nr:hypothetical protein [Myxococcales bacterium]